MEARFEFIQQYGEYTDYETSIDAVDYGGEDVRRLTVVRAGGKPSYAYLTMKDYTEKSITLEEAYKLLAEVC